MWFKEGLTLRSIQGQGGVTSEILYLSDVPESLESPDSPGPAEPTEEATPPLKTFCFLHSETSPLWALRPVTRVSSWHAPAKDGTAPTTEGTSCKKPAGPGSICGPGSEGSGVMELGMQGWIRERLLIWEHFSKIEGPRVLCRLAMGDTRQHIPTPALPCASPSGELTGDWTGMGIRGTRNFDSLHLESRKSMMKTLNLIHPPLVLALLTNINNSFPGLISRLYPYKCCLYFFSCSLTPPSSFRPVNLTLPSPRSSFCSKTQWTLFSPYVMR